MSKGTPTEGTRQDPSVAQCPTMHKVNHLVMTCTTTSITTPTPLTKDKLELYSYRNCCYDQNSTRSYRFSRERKRSGTVLFKSWLYAVKENLASARTLISGTPKSLELISHKMRLYTVSALKLLRRCVHHVRGRDHTKRWDTGSEQAH